MNYSFYNALSTLEAMAHLSAQLKTLCDKVEELTGFAVTVEWQKNSDDIHKHEARFVIKCPFTETKHTHIMDLRELDQSKLDQETAVRLFMTTRLNSFVRTQLMPERLNAHDQEKFHVFGQWLTSWVKSSTTVDETKSTTVESTGLQEALDQARTRRSEYAKEGVWVTWTEYPEGFDTGYLVCEVTSLDLSLPYPHEESPHLTIDFIVEAVVQGYDGVKTIDDCLKVMERKMIDKLKSQVVNQAINVPHFENEPFDKSMIVDPIEPTVVDPIQPTVVDEIQTTAVEKKKPYHDSNLFGKVIMMAFKDIHNSNEARAQDPRQVVRWETWGNPFSEEALPEGVVCRVFDTTVSDPEGKPVEECLGEIALDRKQLHERWSKSRKMIEVLHEVQKDLLAMNHVALKDQSTTVEEDEFDMSKETPKTYCFFLREVVTPAFEAFQSEPVAPDRDLTRVPRWEMEEKGMRCSLYDYTEEDPVEKSARFLASEYFGYKALYRQWQNSAYSFKGIMLKLQAEMLEKYNQAH